MPARKTKRKTSSKRKAVATKKPATKAAATDRINFVPNDPEAVAFLPLRKVIPRREGGAGHARFKFEKPPAPAALHAPGTPAFLFWQSREAALAAVEAYEWAAGPFKAWAKGARSPLPLFYNAGTDLNAYYDRNSVSFFAYTTRGITTFSGASTDVVAHEVGHGLLDALRPDLWTSNLPEHGAFHEAFGDCIAMLTAFADAATCRRLASSPGMLDAANFVEATAEDLSAGVKRALGASHPASQPRHAFNTYVWRLPSSLPTTGGPNVLTGEVHSFARVFTGCFYDTIRFIFHSYASQTARTLQLAARTAGGLLVAGAAKAVEQARFFQAVGEAMLQADESENSGENHQAVINAFRRHGISLAMPDRAFQERSLLTGGAASRARAGARAGASPRVVEAEVRRRVGAEPGTRLARSEIAIGSERVDKYVHQREVSLSGLSERLSNVSALAPEPVMVGGARRGYAAVRSALPDPAGTESEVRFFVRTLLDRGSIAFDGTIERPRGSRRAAARAAAIEGAAKPKPVTQQSDVITHVVRERGGKGLLERVRFACGCTRHDA